MVNLILFDVCAVVIIITLIFALMARKLTRGRTNVLFMGLVLTVLVSSILDIVNVMYNNNILECNEFNTGLRAFLSYAYFIVRNLGMPMLILYIGSFYGVWHRIFIPRFLWFHWAMPYLIELAILLSNPLHQKVFYYDDNLNYCRGPLFAVLYIIAAYYVAVATMMIFMYRRLLPKRCTRFLAIYLFLHAFTISLPLMVPFLRIEMVASALLVLSLAIELHRPEDMIDYVVGCGSHNAFFVDCKKKFEAESPQNILLIKFVNHNVLRSSLGHSLYNTMLAKLSDKMYQISKIMKVGCDIYHLDNGIFVIDAPMGRYEQLLDMGRIIAAYLLEPMKLRQMEVMLDASICLVRCPEDISNWTSLINFVHSFHNRLPKSNRVISLSSISGSKDFKMRSDIDTIINRGIKNFNFQMYYQPIYSVEKKKFVSAEALIRLQDEVYGFVSPGLFIPAAEESGAIHQIGDFVLEDVFRFIGDNDFDSLGLEYIELNLSVAQCIEENLFEKVVGFMNQYNVQPSQVNLEITETSVDYDPVTTDRNINKLAQKGISFSLDDYGTGYSNIKRVVSLPLNIVKLDKSLVDDMDSGLMWIVIKNTVAMLKKMNKKILVEGVEDKRTLDRFIELGVDYIQGYYFSKPLPESQFLKFILKENFGLDV